MATFYSRYVPNGNSVSTRYDIQGIPSKKRKLDENGSEPRQETNLVKATTLYTPRIDQSRTAIEDDRADGRKSLLKPRRSDAKNISRDIEEPDESFKVESGKEGNPPLDEPLARPRKKERKCRRTHPKDQEPGLLHKRRTPQQKAVKTNEPTLVEFKQKRSEQNGKEAENAANAVNIVKQGPQDDPDQHVSIRSKFEKATKKIGEKDRSSLLDFKRTQNEPSPSRELHGLEPLPQPAPLPEEDERPIFSSLPPWLANPLRVDLAQSIDFSHLGLDPAVLDYVTKQGLQKAFPVQSAVIPLLIEGPHRYRGDVCISAATGSGKTLAYVVPMIQSLSKLASTRLRGLVVVPTRELVKQAREVCEACAAGTNMKIATALGSKSLFDEQNLLVERYEAYDPEEYRRRQDEGVNWSKVNLEDMLSELDSANHTATNFAVRYRSKVDVLICTPGRLVDHIRNTKGFTLDDVQWLIIDEADRLLNESFQEWTDFVMPALQSRASYALQDGILHSMRLELPERVVQKVILSATMTQDIEKFKSLKLRNPKLVVVGDVAVNMEGDMVEVEPHLGRSEEKAIFNLPSTLAEFAVPIGDGADKPLYLLDLLRTKVNVFNMPDIRNARSSSVNQDDETSCSDSSDWDSDSDSESTTSSDSSPSILSMCAHQKPDGSSQSVDGKPANTVLIFTRSTESATRLSRLLSLLSTPISSLTTTLTKSSTSSSTRKALAKFRQHKIRIIIATDRASRGLDLANLGHVISYDVPTSMTTYVHRVGRTARAGKAGSAWTLLAHHEARWFWNAIGKGVAEVGRIVRKGKVQRFNLNLDARLEDGTRERYKKALKKLGEEVVGRSVNGKVK